MANQSGVSPLQQINNQSASLGCKTPPLEEINSHPALGCKTLPLQSLQKLEVDQNSTNNTDNSKCKVSSGSGLPDRLQLPKPFKYPERYMSPTDRMISPISKGLLSRSRRGGALLPPSKIHSKIHELRTPNMEQTKLFME